MFCSATELAVLAMAASRIHTEIDAAAAHLLPSVVFLGAGYTLLRDALVTANKVGIATVVLRQRSARDEDASPQGCALPTSGSH